MAALKESSGIITFTTDWGERDYYAGAVKGSVYSLMREATLVDITHTIKPFDIAGAAYILKNAFKAFTTPFAIKKFKEYKEDYGLCTIYNNSTTNSSSTTL